MTDQSGLTDDRQEKEETPVISHSFDHFFNSSNQNHPADLPASSGFSQPPAPASSTQGVSSAVGETLSKPVVAPDADSAKLVAVPVAPETPSQIQERVLQDKQVKDLKSIKRTYKLGSAVGVIFGSIEAALAIRLVFKLLGAQTANAFVGFLYRFTGVFEKPFQGIFGGNPLFAGFELDLAAVVAMVIYALVGFGVLRLTKLF